MTRFLDGMAEGQTLMLKRAPFFLRVVMHAGKFDALDQLDDEPAPNEAAIVYLRQPGAQASAIHLNVGRGKAGGGWFTRADYRLSPVQPADDIMRSMEGWRQWCQAHKAAEHEEPLSPELIAAGWLPMWTEPRQARSFRALMSDGSELPDVHFAEDLSGEEQPAFSGWFVPCGPGFVAVKKPLAWRPIEDAA